MRYAAAEAALLLLVKPTPDALAAFHAANAVGDTRVFTDGDDQGCLWLWLWCFARGVVVWNPRLFCAVVH